MPLEDGIYIITNIKQRNLVFLENPDDCTPLQGHYRKNDLGEQWRFIDRGNGQHCHDPADCGTATAGCARGDCVLRDYGLRPAGQLSPLLHTLLYTRLLAACEDLVPETQPQPLSPDKHSIWNVGYKRYANCGSLAKLGASVDGHGREQLWHIQERSKGKYTIAATDTGNLWMLPYDQPGTPLNARKVKLLDKPTDERCWWSFTNPETEAPVNEDDTNEYILFELKLLPILPFSPLNLDFVIIQEISEDLFSNASRTIGQMCGPLVSSRRSQPEALCANVIEFRAPSSNKVFFQRFSGFITFKTLRNIENTDVSWTRCSSSSLPEIAIHGLRADATKVAILNLNFTLLQQGGQPIITLINHLVKQDVILILTPIQPSWRDAFYKGHIFQELDKLSFESRLFEKTDEFLSYVLDYDEAVALPRLAKYPGLRDEVRPSIPHIIEFLKGENPETQLAAVAALSQLAEHAELHDTIFEAMVEIVEMLKNESHDVRSAAAAILVKLAEHVKSKDATQRPQLHDMIFQAVHRIIEMHLRETGCEHFIKRAESHEVKHICRDVSGRTALSWAAGSGWDAVVQILLAQKGVEVDAKDNSNKTPLSLAAGNGHDAVVRQLLAQEGVEANSKDRSNRTPLSWAAKNGHDAVVQIMLAQKGVEVDAKDYSNQTPLSLAAENGHDAVVRLLLAQNGVDVNSQDILNRTPLSWAAKNGHDTVVRLLLAQNGVDVNSKDGSNQTPLLWAAENGHDAVVRLLLAQEAVDVNSKDDLNRTPLSWAAENGHDAVVRLLLAQEGVDVNSKDTPKQTPLSWAAENGHDAVVRLLLAQEGVDVNSKDSSKHTPLSWAAENGHDAIVQQLLAQEGVDVNSKDYLDRTPLSQAAENGYDAVVRLLLAHGAVDTRRKKWWRK